ncbi:carbohydrate esterase family 8 protein [Piloderma croceum F 1598]|uniref:Pectinesterase n=1 Tax=Piloderma croceum (strain F 1598) TaxID=765440 RepID=A0A0C3FH28_PILCF|nr:carbohydrate esterase family 8 protein [Piloderma croceum F 1598]
MVYSYFFFALVALNLVHSTLATQRNSPPTGSITVGPSGTYKTISAAVAAASKGASIFIYAGTYNEAVYITVDNLKIYGQTDDTSSYKSNTVIISSNGAMATKGNDDASGTLRVHANSFAMYNMKIVNTYGTGDGVGSQALALSAYGTEQGFYGCSFVGYQDTVLTDTGTQYFGHSYIEGAVDFIFGQTAKTYIKSSVIASVAAGTITASGSLSTGEGIYVIDSCTIKAADDAKSALTQEVYLGRPWTQYAQAVFKDCSLSDIINPAGWEKWSTSEPNTADVLFAEYGNTGAGSTISQRASFSTMLTSSSVAKYSISAILGSGYTAWVDSNYS